MSTDELSPPAPSESQRAYAIQAGLDPNRLPVHVAIIMDGNGRWASTQGEQRVKGHFQGYLALKEMVYACDDLGVRYLTVYAFSSENWRRPEEEVHALMELMAYAMQAHIDELIVKNVRVRAPGRMAALPPEVQEVFMDSIRRTAHCTGMTFSLAINYGGRAEVVDAVRLLAAKVQRGELAPEAIGEAEIASHLYSPDVPDPDLLIRTAGELRLSNFLLWETAYSEIYVTQTCWPDFGREQLFVALRDFQRRVRKFGAVVE